MISVILPTFNEAENLPIIVPAILEQLQKASIEAEVIVVDDNSPDQTAEVAKSLADYYSVRVLCRRDKRGLASAVLDGFRLSKAEVCLVMDADGSHPVERLPDMVRPILENRADITVGSRAIAGGSIEQWTWLRRLVSKGAGMMARGLTPMTDPTSGFMAIRRDFLANLKLDPIGWKIVLEIVVKASPCRLIEVPIVFRDRRHGQSKFNFGPQRDYFLHLLRLYAFKLRKR